MSTTNLPLSEPPRPDRCEMCRFWSKTDPITGSVTADPVESPDDEGQCRAHPPPHVPTVLYFEVIDDDETEGKKSTATSRSQEAYRCVNSGNAWSFPVLTAGDWCGEWQAKPT